MITPELRPRLYDYLGGIIRAQDGVLIAAGGPSDHLHLLAATHKTHALTDDIRIWKTNASRWIHETFPHLQQFAWQEGYSAFTISYPGLERVKAYIAHQEAHHQTESFKDELRRFLDEHGIPYDERYLFD